MQQTCSCCVIKQGSPPVLGNVAFFVTDLLTLARCAVCLVRQSVTPQRKVIGMRPPMYVAVRYLVIGSALDVRARSQVVYQTSRRGHRYVNLFGIPVPIIPWFVTCFVKCILVRFKRSIENFFIGGIPGSHSYEKIPYSFLLSW